MGDSVAGFHPIRSRPLWECLHHPLTIKFAGRWLSLKRATSGGQKGIDEILNEINTAMVEAKDEHCGDSVDVLHALLKRAMSPLVKGKGTSFMSCLYFTTHIITYRNLLTLFTSA